MEIKLVSLLLHPMNLIESWKDRSKDDSIANKKFLAKLAKSKDKKLNALADDLHEEVFEEIDCLDCGNCCKSIPPIVNEMDVKRAAKFLGMKPTDFKEQYVRIDDDQDMVIGSSPCPFLESDNKCFIYDGRPRACQEYPHTDNYEFLKHTRIHLPNSEYCPAVFHILERMRKVQDAKFQRPS